MIFNETHRSEHRFHDTPSILLFLSDDEINEHDFVNLIAEHLFGVCVAATPSKLHKVNGDITTL